MNPVLEVRGDLHMGICCWDAARHLRGSRQQAPRRRAQEMQGVWGRPEWPMSATSMEASVQVKFGKEILEMSS